LATKDLNEGRSSESVLDKMSPFTQRNAVKLVKKGEKDIEAILQRLDRFTQDATQGEIQTTAAGTLKIDRDPVQNMRGVMDGEQAHPSTIPPSLDPFHLQGNTSANSDREALGMFCRGQRVPWLTER